MIPKKFATRLAILFLTFRKTPLGFDASKTEALAFIDRLKNIQSEDGRWRNRHFAKSWQYSIRLYGRCHIVMKTILHNLEAFEMRSGSSVLLAVFVVIGVLMFAMEASAQNKTYIWVRSGETGQYPGYKKVIGGRLDKGGVDMPVCRGVVNGYLMPGKMYGASCLIPWGDKELNITQGVDLLLTNRSWSWKQIYGLSKSQIEQGAVPAGNGSVSTGAQFVCRWRFANGVHSGYYLMKHGACYVAFGGRSYSKTDGFEIMFP